MRWALYPYLREPERRPEPIQKEMKVCALDEEFRLVRITCISRPL